MSGYIRRVHREEQGFSLIELLIVIVVLGILGGIVVFGVATFRLDSDKAACKAQADTIKTAASAYKAKNPGIIPGATSNDRVTTLFTANYLEDNPTVTTPTYTAVIVLAANGKVTETCSTLT